MIQGKEQPIILIIDDEKEIASLLETVLKREGFESVHTASTAKQGLEAFKKLMPDLVLLDIMLPDGDGYELFKDFQKIKSVPILYISAKNEEVDRLLGFALGAEDYITKPFSPKEVAYRVKARLKYLSSTYIEEKEIQKKEMFCFGDICIDPDAGVIRKKDKVLDFTAKEYKILLYFTENPNRILSKEMICQEIWGEDFFGFDNTISVHIRKIRLKIEDDPSKPQWIQTVIGLGYKFVINRRAYET
ncbi:response regulator transcription factor [Natronincola ferrireducens]|uniref:Stage 0 sporulation protein A homolog n=1 Tax=Natronincola ferrireducens TaxID=393762 RepID=A0A1G9ITI1_9FIRM|nr:response regulator transcription factor [Natronincola ferrireducens]SDL28422.1 DNA-binding response regulator, OmpR family, contains REC and winged-helix (wHTH) domain [Natronincola ferrireducens]